MPRPISLIMGIRKWLDATADIHNGRDFARFEADLELLAHPDPFSPFRVTKTGLAKAWNVHRHTFQSWIDQYNKEHDTNNDRPAV